MDFDYTLTNSDVDEAYSSVRTAENNVYPDLLGNGTPDLLSSQFIDLESSDLASFASSDDHNLSDFERTVLAKGENPYSKSEVGVMLV